MLQTAAVSPTNKCLIASVQKEDVCGYRQGGRPVSQKLASLCYNNIFVIFVLYVFNCRWILEEHFLKYTDCYMVSLI